MVMIAAIVLIGAALFLLSLSFRLLKKPLAWILKFLLHAAMGYAFLFLFDFVGAWVGVSLGLNWINAAVAGVLGVPGVILLLLVKYLL